MNLDHLRTLTVVAERGSLTAAGRQLHLTPAAIHKHLKQLEVELGVPLYRKSGRGIQLSAAVSILLPYAESALSQVRAAQQAIDEWRGLRRGVVRLGTGPTLGSHWLPKLIERYRDRHPSVVVTVETGSSSELLQSARHGRIDLALLLAAPLRSEPGFEVMGRWRSNLVFVTGDSSLPAGATLRELSPLPFVGFGKGSRMSDTIERVFAQSGLQANTIMRFDNADAIRAMLRTGIGYSLLPGWTVEDDLASGILRLLRPRGKPPVIEVELVRYAEHPIAPAALEFADIARKQTL